MPPATVGALAQTFRKIALMHSVVTAIGDLLHHYGYVAIIVFFVLEGSGIPVPSETMLVTAAAYAAHGRISQPLVLLAATIGGILGGHSGYAIGKYGGLRLVLRFGRFFRLDAERLARAREFFSQRGARAVFLSKSIAFLRIIVPMLAGVTQMSFGRFTVANAAGAALSAILYGSLGYFFGRDLPKLEDHIVLATTILLALVVVYFIFKKFRRQPSAVQ
jgi:membrane protein DedA with SNARE-associated domain